MFTTVNETLDGGVMGDGKWHCNYLQQVNLIKTTNSCTKCNLMSMFSITVPNHPRSVVVCNNSALCS